MQIISGEFKGRKLISPKGDNTRPTSGVLREAFFNICQNYIEDSVFLDLFSGSGAIGLEALSRGANSAIFVDNNKESIRAIKQNVEALKVENQSLVVFGDVFSIVERLAKQGKQFTIVYADPPYNTMKHVKGREIPLSHQLIRIMDESSLLAPEGSFFIEEDEDAPEYTEALTKLYLKNSRKLGRSVLRQYHYKGIP